MSACILPHGEHVFSRLYRPECSRLIPIASGMVAPVLDPKSFYRPSVSVLSNGNLVLFYCVFRNFLCRFIRAYHCYLSVSPPTLPVRRPWPEQHSACRAAPAPAPACSTRSNLRRPPYPALGGRLPATGRLHSCSNLRRTGLLHTAVAHGRSGRHTPCTLAVAFLGAQL